MAAQPWKTHLTGLSELIFIFHGQGHKLRILAWRLHHSGRLAFKWYLRGQLDHKWSKILAALSIGMRPSLKFYNSLMLQTATRNDTPYGVVRLPSIEKEDSILSSLTLLSELQLNTRFWVLKCHFFFTNVTTIQALLYVGIVIGIVRGELYLIPETASKEWWSQVHESKICVLRRNTSQLAVDSLRSGFFWPPYTPQYLPN